MNKLHASLALALLAALVAAPAVAQKEAGKKKLYCWNEAGRKVCGDALPASAVDSARTEISATSGLPTARVGRALTPEEQQAAAQRAEAERQAQLAASAQRMREYAMAESYSTEDELRRAFSNRIALLDDTIRAGELSIGSLRQSLLSLLRRAGEAELAGRPVAAPLADNIQKQHAELIRQQALLVTHKQNRLDIDAELEHALQTYREIKTPGTPAAGTAPVTGNS